MNGGNNGHELNNVTYKQTFTDVSDLICETGCSSPCKSHCDVWYTGQFSLCAGRQQLAFSDISY